MPHNHNTDTPTAKRPHWMTIIGGILFLLVILRPDLAQKMAGKPEAEVATLNTAPQHFDGEVVSIVSGGDYVHPGASQSNTFTGGLLVVRDKGGAEFVVYPTELNGKVTETTSRLVKTVHNGKLSFSPWRDDFKVQTTPTGLKGSYDDYGYDYGYVAVDQYGNVTDSNGKELSDAEKDKHRASYATWPTTRVAQKFGANSAESKKLDEMKQNYKSDIEVIQVASEMLPELARPPSLPSDEEIIENAERALKDEPTTPPTPTKPQ